MEASNGHRQTVPMDEDELRPTEEEDSLDSDLNEFELDLPSDTVANIQNSNKRRRLIISLLICFGVAISWVRRAVSSLFLLCIVLLLFALGFYNAVCADC